MTYDEAVRKATKLLRLAGSGNAHEAAAAAAAANEIMSRYRISSMATEAYVEHEEIGMDELLREKKRSYWKGQLALALARSHACGVYYHNDELRLVGRPSDTRAVRYLFGFLLREVERLTKRECVGLGKTYANNFKIGVVEEVRSMLAIQKVRMHDDLKSTGTSVVHVDRALIERQRQEEEIQEYLRTLKLRRQAAGRINTDWEARFRGRAAGREIQLNRASGALDGPTKSQITKARGRISA